MLSDQQVFCNSSKEKRLCAQVLAGCVFNELLPSNPKLMQGFLLYLGRAHELTCREFGFSTEPQVQCMLQSLISDLERDELRVNLVNCAYQAGEVVNPMDSIDLCIAGRQAMVAVDFAYPLGRAEGQTDHRHSEPAFRSTSNRLQVLLVTRRSWAGGCREALRRHVPGEQPFQSACPHAVAFWEDILALVSRFAGPRPLLSYLFGLLDF